VVKREISNIFFDKRTHFQGAYFIDLEYVEPKKWVTPKKYKGYKFTRDLTVDMTGEDVNALQEILKANGYFPNMKTTQFFGGITRQAVKDFQKKYEESILWVVGLKMPTGYFGKSSRKVLNNLIA
jgi:peptidoglycan hydrolase-like protein with peptidoglycan-binding domain